MKSVKAAAFIFIFVLILTIGNSVVLHHKLSDIQALTLKISDDADLLSNAENKERISALADVWNENMPYFSYVCSYAALNRADEAVTEVIGTHKNEAYADTVTAREKLLDALRRLLELEHLSFGAVF